MAERRFVRFSGHVQGVGFRYTVHRLASGRAVTGYVRNAADGSVELVAEGEPAILDEFVMAIAAQFEDHMTNVQSSPGPAVGEFVAFEIRR